MKRLLIARHAKSSWKDTDLSDFERPLNKRGKRDLQTIIPILSHLHIRTDEILTSPALRTRLTANALSVVTQPKNIQPTEVARLYSASWETLLDVTSNIDNLHDTVTIVGHNPGLTEFVNALGNLKNLCAVGNAIGYSAFAFEAILRGNCD